MADDNQKRQSNQPEPLYKTVDEELALFKIIADSIQEGVVVCDLSGKFIYRNRAGDEIYGSETPYAPLEKWVEEYGCYLSDGITPYKTEDLPAFRSIHRGEVSKGQEVYLRNPAVPNGLLLSCDTSPFKNSRGETIGAICVFRDITNLTRTSEALRKSELLFRQLVENIHEVFWFASPGLTEVHYVSPAYEKIWGRTLESLREAPLSFLDGIHQDDRENATQIILNSFKHGGGFDLEYRVVRPDGSTRWVWDRGFPVYYESGQMFHQCGLAQDITERKHTEEQLEKARDQALESSRLKSQFVANISHEIRTPLTAVIGLTEILLSRVVNEEERQLCLQCYKSAQALLAIVNDILDFSKIEAGKQGIEVTEFDLRLLIQETVGMFERQAAEKGLTMSLSVDPKLAEIVVSDSNRLQQILTNLLSNSIKFTEKGSIKVSVMPLPKDDIMVEFSVEDTGIGLSEAEIATLFRPFVQVNGESTRRHGGTGLGLSISKHLVEMMGGEIGVQSAKGQGSKFWFWVPLRRASLPSLTDSGRQRVIKDNGQMPKVLDPIAGERGPVLIVEDNVALQKLILFQLRHLGINAEIAATGIEAVQAIKNKTFALILMDVQMPEMDGYQATAKIRELEKNFGKRTPIVALTASAMAGDRERCLEAGMDDYLVKPVTLENFKQVVERWLTT